MCGSRTRLQISAQYCVGDRAPRPKRRRRLLRSLRSRSKRHPHADHADDAQERAHGPPSPRRQGSPDSSSGANSTSAEWHAARARRSVRRGSPSARRSPRTHPKPDLAPVCSTCPPRRRMRASRCSRCRILTRESVVRFSQDGSRLALGLHESIRIYDARGGRLIKELNQPDATLLAFTANNAKLVAYSASHPDHRQPGRFVNVPRGGP